MAPLKGELAAKRSEGLSPKGADPTLTSATRNVPPGVALIRPGFAGPPSPQGKALSTRYNFAEQYHPKKPSPGVKLSGGQFDSVKSSLNKGGCEADG